MKSFRSTGPKDLSEALALLQMAKERDEIATPAGGGSDLLGMIKDGVVAPDVLIHLGAVNELSAIDAHDDGVRIGGLVTLSHLARHPAVRSDYAVLAEAAASVGTPQIRNVGTLAGNVCQRPWCWYLRQGFPCYKNGGDVCFSWVGENQFNAIFGGGPSYIVHPSDTAPALVALDARFRIAGPSGERTVPASEFFVSPDRDVSRENVLEDDELLTEVELPRPARGTKSRYAKIMDREAWTHAVVSVAVVLSMDGEMVDEARLVLGGVAPIPWRLPEVEGMLRGRTLTPALAAEAARQAVSGAEPLSKNGYKVPLTENLLRRAFLEVAG